MATEKESVKYHFIDFSSNTSLHGIKYTNDSRRPLVERIFWIVAILLSFSVCIYLIFELWVKWQDNPVIVSPAETPTPISHIPFPAVTICSRVMYDMRLFNFTEICNKSKENNNETLSIYDALVSKCFVNPLNRTTENVTEEVVRKFVEVSKNMSDVFMNCEFGPIKGCENLFTPILTNEGICFTFNMLNAKEIYSQGIQRDFNFHLNHNRKSIGWSPDTMYDKNLSNEPYPWRRKGHGLFAGLNVHLKSPKVDDYDGCSNMFRGFKLILHTPDAIPQAYKDFSWLSQKTYSMVVIKPRMTSISNGIKHHDPERRRCYFSDERKLQYFRRYNRDNCFLECIANYTKAICGCVEFGMPRDKSTLICAIGKKDCVANVTEYVHGEELVSGYEEKLDSKNVTRCGCLPSCTSVSYDKIITQPDLYWEQFYKAVKDTGYNGENDYVNENFNKMGVTLYFDQPEFETSKRSELYDVVDFLSRCGGILGLCLGFSVLSLVEIIYFFIIRVGVNTHGTLTRKINPGSRL